MKIAIIVNSIPKNITLAIIAPFAVQKKFSSLLGAEGNVGEVKESISHQSEFSQLPDFQPDCKQISADLYGFKQPSKGYSEV